MVTIDNLQETTNVPTYAPIRSDLQCAQKVVLWLFE